LGTRHVTVPVVPNVPPLRSVQAVHRQGRFKSSRFGSNNTIWLKAKRNLAVILDTLTCNLCVVRVHAFVACEISLLQGQSLSLRLSTSSVQSVQMYLENPQEAAWRQAAANASWGSQSSIARWPHAENSRSTLRTYSSRFQPPFSSSAATVRIGISAFALAQGSLGLGVGRALFPLSRKRLGLVYDGGQALPSKSRRLPRPGALAGQRKYAGLVPGIHNDPRIHTQTHPGFGLRRGCGNYQARYEPGLDCAALPFSSHQPIAELPRTEKPKVGGEALA